MGGWSENDEKEMYKVLSHLHKRGVRFALSNVIEHKGMENRYLIDWARKNKFFVNPINHNYKNSNYQTSAKSSSTREVLVTNY